MGRILTTNRLSPSHVYACFQQIHTILHQFWQRNARCSNVVEKQFDLDVTDVERVHLEKLKGLPKVWKEVRHNLNTAYAKSRQQKSAEKLFEEGELVWKRNYVLSDASKNFAAKLAPRFLKCKVVKRIGNSSYELVIQDGKNVGVWSAVDLKPCKELPKRITKTK